jgi:hypothetical protein
MTLAFLAVLAGTTGYSSCASTTGPLLAPLTIVPGQVYLRASLENRAEGVALARVDGGEATDRYSATVQYGKDAGSDWLTVTAQGRELTLRARPDGLAEGPYLATVTVESDQSDASGTLQVEFSVTR